MIKRVFNILGVLRMKIYVKYLAAVSDYTGKREEEINIPDGSTLSDLLNIIREKYPELKKFESKFMLLILLNGVNSPGNTKLSDGDRVALLPPVSGG